MYFLVDYWIFQWTWQSGCLYTFCCCWSWQLHKSKEFCQLFVFPFKSNNIPKSIAECLYSRPLSTRNRKSKGRRKIYVFMKFISIWFHFLARVKVENAIFCVLSNCWTKMYACSQIWRLQGVIFNFYLLTRGKSFLRTSNPVCAIEFYVLLGYEWRASEELLHWLSVGENGDIQKVTCWRGLRVCEGGVGWPVKGLPNLKQTYFLIQS